MVPPARNAHPPSLPDQARLVEHGLHGRQLGFPGDALRDHVDAECLFGRSDFAQDGYEEESTALDDVRCLILRPLLSLSSVLFGDSAFLGVGR